MPRLRRQPKERRTSFPEPIARYLLGELTADEGHDAFEALVESGEVANRWQFQTLFWDSAIGTDRHESGVWAQLRDEVLPEYIREYPGRRPSGWWSWSAPRASDEQLRAWHFPPKHYYFSAKRRHERPCDPRKRLGGTGTARHEVLTVSPLFCDGIVGPWLSRQEIEALETDGPPRRTRFRDGRFRGVFPDPDDPLAFESEAAYLKRHGLLLFPGEEERLGPADFQPELIAISEGQCCTTA